MNTKIGKIGPKIGPQETMLELTSSGFWAYMPKFMTAAKFYSVNNVTISTHRNFVEHTVPGRKGSVFQDMGRPAIKIVIEGNLNESSFATGWNSKSKPMLAELHKLCDEGKPLGFVCDMPALFGVSQVVIVDLEASEAKGRKYDYDYKLTLKEWSDGGSKSMMAEYMKSRSTAATKKFLKKGAIVLAASGVVTGYAVTKGIKEELPLVVTLRFSAQRVKVDQSCDIKAIVSNNKGARVEGATVNITYVKGPGTTEQTIASGLTTDADGLATKAAFTWAAAGTYMITAKATMAGYTEGSGTSEVIVDEKPVTP